MAPLEGVPTPRRTATQHLQRHYPVTSACRLAIMSVKPHALVRYAGASGRNLHGTQVELPVEDSSETPVTVPRRKLIAPRTTRGNAFLTQYPVQSY